MRFIEACKEAINVLWGLITFERRFDDRGYEAHAEDVHREVVDVRGQWNDDGTRA